MEIVTIASAILSVLVSATVSMMIANGVRKDIKKKNYFLDFNRQIKLL
jgi:hypothetical protein